MTAKRMVIIVGGVVWLVACGLLKLPLEAAILLFSPLVLVPLGMSLVKTPATAIPERRLLTLASWLQLPAATALAVSFAWPQGWQAAALALPWLLMTALLALTGVFRLWREGWRLDGELAVTVALLFILVGGGWAVVSRAGLRPQDFTHAIVLLTAVHFHYAGFALPLLAGMSVAPSIQSLPRSRGGLTCDRLILLGVIIGVPAVGVGISLSPHIEVVSALVLALASLGVAVRQVQEAWQLKNPSALALACVSSLALVSAMGLAGTYAVSEFLGQRWIEIPTMIHTHGAFNAFGFAACGLAARAWREHPAVV